MAETTIPPGTTPPGTDPTATATPRKKRRWLRRIAIAVVVLGVLVTFAPFALSLGPVRRWAAGKVSDAVGRTVTIGGITARWWSGIECRDVVVANPEGFTGEPLLRVERVHADLYWLPLVSGSVRGSVEVLRPVATLLRKPTGERNTDSPSRAGEGARGDGSAEGGDGGDGALDLSVTVSGGKVVSRETGGAAPGEPEVVDAIEALLHVGGGSAIRGRVTAVARGAAEGGGDAKIEATADLDAKGAGTLVARVPSVDLARLKRLMGSALGLDAVAGTASADADLAFDAEGRASGTVKARLAGVAVRRGPESVSLRRASVDVGSKREGERDRVLVEATLEGLDAAGFASSGERLTEERLVVGGVVSRDSSGNVSFGEAGAPVRIEGRIVSGTLSGALSGSGSDAAADLAGDLTVVLSPTLGRWLGVISEPGEDLRGTVRVRGRASGKGGVIQSTLDASVSGLVLGGGAGNNPLREPGVTLAAAGAFDRAAGTLTLSSATVSAGSLAAKASERFVVSGLAEGRPLGFTGAIAVDGDLSRLSGGLRAFVPALDDFPAGLVHVDARASPGGDRARGTSVAWSVKATGLVWREPSLASRPWSEREVSASGRFDLPEKGDPALTLTVFRSALASLVEGKGVPTVRFGEAGVVVEGGAAVTADLAAASRAFDVALSLAPGESLSGTATVAVTGRASGGDVAVDAFDASLLGLDVKGRLSIRGGIGAEASGRAEGDLSRLAREAKRLLGESFDDVEGAGALSATFSMSVPEAAGVKGLVADASLAIARVTSAGFSLSEVRGTVKRSRASEPLAVAVAASANGGTLRLEGTFDLARDGTPWRGKADLQSVDTAPLITGKGVGRFLPMVLPTILPAGASTPVLSGRMTARADLVSSALSGDALLDGLSGPGTVVLTQGTVSNSTLFSALGAGAGSKGLGTLMSLVPDVNKAFKDVGRTLLFTNLMSRFEVGGRKIRVDPVSLASQTVSLDFSGTVGFDGALSLKIPVRLEGDAGKAVKEYVPSRTIPVKVTGTLERIVVVPDLDLKDLAGKSLLDELKKRLR